MQADVANVLYIVIFVIFVVWLCIPISSIKTDQSPDLVETAIDPNDARQIGLIMGMTGGSVTDAAVMRYAIQRFEETHGRKATMKDVGILVGLIHSM